MKYPILVAAIVLISVGGALVIAWGITYAVKPDQCGNYSKIVGKWSPCQLASVSCFAIGGTMVIVGVVMLIIFYTCGDTCRNGPKYSKLPTGPPKRKRAPRKKKYKPPAHSQPYPGATAQDPSWPSVAADSPAVVLPGGQPGDAATDYKVAMIVKEPANIVHTTVDFKDETKKRGAAKNAMLVVRYGGQDYFLLVTFQAYKKIQQYKGAADSAENKDPKGFWLVPYYQEVHLPLPGTDMYVVVRRKEPRHTDTGNKLPSAIRVNTRSVDDVIGVNNPLLLLAVDTAFTVDVRGVRDETKELSLTIVATSKTTMTLTSAHPDLVFANRNDAEPLRGPKIIHNRAEKRARLGLDPIRPSVWDAKRTNRASASGAMLQLSQGGDRSLPLDTLAAAAAEDTDTAQAPPYTPAPAQRGDYVPYQSASSSGQQSYSTESGYAPLARPAPPSGLRSSASSSSSFPQGYAPVARPVPPSRASPSAGYQPSRRPTPPSGTRFDREPSYAMPSSSRQEADVSVNRNQAQQHIPATRNTRAYGDSRPPNHHHHSPTGAAGRDARFSSTDWSQEAPATEF